MKKLADRDLDTHIKLEITDIRLIWSSNTPLFPFFLVCWDFYSNSWWIIWSGYSIEYKITTTVWIISEVILKSFIDKQSKNTKKSRFSKNDEIFGVFYCFYFCLTWTLSISCSHNKYQINAKKSAIFYPVESRWSIYVVKCAIFI